MEICSTTQTNLANRRELGSMGILHRRNQARFLLPGTKSWRLVPGAATGPPDLVLGAEGTTTGTCSAVFTASAIDQINPLSPAFEFISILFGGILFDRFVFCLCMYQKKMRFLIISTFCSFWIDRCVVP